MSEITRAVLGMPYEIAMVDEISRRQFFDRAHTEIATLQARLSELEAVTLERAAEVAAGPAEAWGEFPGGTPERDRIAAAIRALKGGAR